MTYTVITCTPTQDGNYMVMLSANRKAPVIVRSSPVEFQPGDRVTLNHQDQVVKA